LTVLKMPNSARNRKLKVTPAAARTDMASLETPRKEEHLRTPKRLVRGFYNRDPRVVARELLGKLLIREERGQRLAGRIVETEAYLGKDDAAAHSAAGHTPRNSVLFGPPGFVYVYFIYGMHYCFNVSCLPAGEAGGVLIRALEPIRGIEAMAANRDIELSKAPRLTELRSIASGPGRLAEALGITRSRDNGKDVTAKDSDLWIGEDGFQVNAIAETARVGITKSVDELLRFVVVGNAFVSGKRASTSEG
jgi:DNA-3-methyladenine glycosylase